MDVDVPIKCRYVYENADVPMECHAPMDVDVPMKCPCAYECR